MSTCKIRFEGSEYPEIEIEPGENLSERFDASNSPLLFGCRTGICGTCVVEVQGQVLPPSEDEQEILELYADGNPNVRLACQLHVISDVTLRPFDG